MPTLKNCLLFFLLLLCPALQAQPELTVASKNLEEQTKQWFETLSALQPEEALLAEVARLAAHYGFTSKQYRLDQIKTAHSFASNLEISIPPNIEDMQDIEAQELQELVLLTPASDILNLSTLLAFMQLSAAQPLPRPVRIVLLGSELKPQGLSSLQQFPQLSYAPFYRLGSFSFLHRYKTQKPYLLLYFESAPLEDFTAEQADLLDKAWQFLQGKYRERYQLPDPPEKTPYQIIYKGSQTQSAIQDVRLLSKALNGIPNSSIQYTESPAIDPYLDLPAVGLRQISIEQSTHLARALYKLGALKKAAQHSTPERNYWLRNSVYISEHRILWLVLAAIIIFAYLSRRQKMQKLIVALFFSIAFAFIAGILTGLLQSFWGSSSLYLLSVAKIGLTLILLYILAMLINIGNFSISASSLYVAFGILALSLWLDFSSAIWGLYLFFGTCLYLVLAKYRSKYIFVRGLQILGLRGITLLLFLPYFWHAPQSRFGSLFWPTILLLPGILLSFCQAQNYCLQFPQYYRYYLLRRILFYSAVSVLSLALFYFSQENQAEQVGKLQLDEVYILPEDASTAGYKILRVTGGHQKLLLREHILGSEDFTVHSLEKASFERELRPEELALLSPLGAKLLEGESIQIRDYYSSNFRLQSPLNYLHISIVAQPLDLLYSNFPFRIPQNVSGASAANGELKSSDLLMGLHPPAGLKIELLFAQKPQLGFLRYTIEFSDLQNKMEDKMQNKMQDKLQDQLLEQTFSSALSELLTEEGSPQKFHHTIQVRNLIKDL